MASFGRAGLLATAVVFHIVYIFSIFDIYFVSPVVSGMHLFKISRPAFSKPPADRLVLFVGDGLRADKAFQSFPEPYPVTEADNRPRHLAPFLHSQALYNGTFGVSHTRVPTESRPGHVALIAGLYEDVSAVATGWKLNPVNFDSVFNRSHHTWSWGSPDILPMFERGALPGRVDAYSYSSDFEDFSKDATHLDLWVFDHVKELFTQAITNQTLDRALRQDRVVFFLHLLGLDTAGHSYRPYSKEYLHNIKVVDQGVKEITHIIQNFYSDDRTAFVFTADHGMSDWGSHGDGHPDNTRTPLICWGSGVAAPQTYPGTIAPGHDSYSADWDLDHIRRHDVAQADVAALMSYLIGTEFPANSVGKLPLAYLAADNREKAEASIANAQGILEIYRVKEERKKVNELRYKPYPLLSGDGLAPDQRIAGINELIASGKYEEAIEESDTLIGITLDGIHYLQTYDWLFLRAVITLGYLGWMAYAFTAVINMFVLCGTGPPKRSIPSTMLFSSVLAASFASFYLSNSPLSYYVYTFFPVMFWEQVYVQRHSLALGRKVLFAHITSAGSVLTFALQTALYVAVIESLALSYIYREILTALYILGSLWPLTYGIAFLRSHILLSATWCISCLVMSTFTLLPAMKVESLDLILAGGTTMAFVGLIYLGFENYLQSQLGALVQKPGDASRPVLDRAVTGAQVGFIFLSLLVTHSSSKSLQAKQGLPFGNQVVGWFVLVMSLLMPIVHRRKSNRNYLHRLAAVFLTCAPAFLILTISYEALFYVAYSIMLITWVQLESSIQAFPLSQINESSKVVAAATHEDFEVFRRLKLTDCRVALFFMVLLQSAFFSTGNVASVSSFSLDSVYRLLPIFDPFSQGALLILKLMIPFALISANLGVLNKILRVAPSALFMLVMATSDVLTLYFFWVVKDEGSWLEIGSTISHFVIASLLCVFVAVLEGFSAVFIAGVDIGF